MNKLESHHLRRDLDHENYLFTHPGARKFQDRVDELAIDLHIIGLSLESGLWPPKDWLLALTRKRHPRNAWLTNKWRSTLVDSKDRRMGLNKGRPKKRG